MECKCGGTTCERSHTKTVNKVLIAKLIYDECVTCKLAGNFILYEKGKWTERNADAISKFNEKYGAT